MKNRAEMGIYLIIKIDLDKIAENLVNWEKI